MIDDSLETSDGMGLFTPEALPCPPRQRECGSHRAAWYAVQTRPRREREVAERLTEQNFASFLPLVAVRDRKGEVQCVAAFPSYLFVKFSIHSDPWRRICSTRGVRRLFTADEVPVAVPEAAIAALLAAGFDRPLTAPDTPERIAPGSKVRIQAGAFAGIDGTCLWSDAQRVALLCEIMGGSRMVRIPRQAAVVA